MACFEDRENHRIPFASVLFNNLSAPFANPDFMDDLFLRAWGTVDNFHLRMFGLDLRQATPHGYAVHPPSTAGLTPVTSFPALSGGERCGSFATASASSARLLAMAVPIPREPSVYIGNFPVSLGLHNPSS
jgi:hypothetical protein